MPIAESLLATVAAPAAACLAKRFLRGIKP